MNKNIFLAPLLIVLFSFSLTLLVFSPVSFKNIALALTGNYSKSNGEQLTITDWNNLKNDFLDKSGDTMSGVLNMNNKQIINVADPTADNHAVNKGSMNSTISTLVASLPTATIVDPVTGNNLRMVCGTTAPGFTNWQNYSFNPHAVYLQVDTSSAGFSPLSKPKYITFISGAYTYLTTGVSNIYSPTHNSFDVYVNFLGENNDFRVPSLYGSTFINSTLAKSTFQWTVGWCGVGE